MPSFFQNFSSLTKTLLLQMINKCLESIDNSQIIGKVMVVLRKAFDLVDHTLLLKKLRHYKLSGKTINWFCSYLLDRKQKVIKTILNQELRTFCVVCPKGQSWVLKAINSRQQSPQAWKEFKEMTNYFVIRYYSRWGDLSHTCIFLVS